MTTYKDLDARLTGRNAAARRIGNNTYAERRGDAIAVRLHATDVLTFHKDGRVILNTGGWKTVTTKDRINAYVPHGYRVYSVRGVWYVGRTFYTSAGTVQHVKDVPYADGLTIGPRGGITGEAPKDAAKQDRTLRAQVAAYAIGFLTALDNGEVPAPGPGDCFYCAMRTVENVGDKQASGPPLGEATRNADHIRSHMEEGYYVPSLLVRALETFGASPVCRAYVAGRMHKHSKRNEWYDAVGREQAEKMLRRYVLRQLGGAA